MSEPDFFSSLDDVAEALDDFVKAWNKFVELISEYGARDKGEEIVLRGGPIPDLGKAMIKEVLAQWPSVPSFEILLDDSLMAEATVCSFFGGAPTLPPSIAWPHFVFRKKEEKSMNFLAQVDCAELTRLWPDHPLPKAGFLYFFDSWSAEDGLSCPSCRVIHSYDVPDPRPRAVPSDSIAPRDCLLKYRNAIHTPRPGDETSLAYPRRRLRLAKGKVCLPFTDHLSRDLELFSDVSDEGLQKFRELFDEVYGDLRIASKKTVLGLSGVSWRSYNWSFNRKFKKAKSPEYAGMAVEHRLLGYPVTKASWRGAHYSGQRFEDLVLLAHFDSDIRMDFDWHDDLEFWIRPEDLANGDFSNVIALQWS